MNNNPQNSKISDPDPRTARLLFRLCLMGPSQAAGKGGNKRSARTSGGKSACSCSFMHEEDFKSPE